ncbi:hypothetical protein B0P06_005199 [Clostridium saccharoperbutylacetonicum]|uniref:Uncharacterized protein n=1 Tax=Clostridium saccharoperbutylacetonicum N1-4(HMT) TaxID=931276 RepID=M1MJN5_9CLOT|nr:hypothetical protein [Clostridium saccharoperbutylacetonicum]AGF56528.1 hypothetical protein Cspa_c27650 [Clostridium saccharoperbutylacetonicum N1-4(HMT)]AQR95196.1 hypothetical protein CLSAP_25120 [Clostridium saccharoperbutylacetonicum]NSB45428.1 hypothetical protein [Clostridium saccharoperbutylacetonicum]
MTINSRLGTSLTQKDIVDFVGLIKDIEDLLDEMKQEMIQDCPDED